MKINECKYDLETKFTKGCYPCRKQNFTVRIPKKFKGGILYINLHYALKTCYIGLTEGPFVNAFTLLPAEELELEIIRRSKYTQSFHEERTIEESMEMEINNTFRKEITNKFKINAEIDLDASVDIWLAEASLDIGLDIAYERISETFQETVLNSTYNVSKSQDVVIDIKSEIDHQYKSLRKIKNPNPCQAVTYFFFQLMKKYESKLFLESITFDFSKELLPRFKALSETYTLKSNRPLIESSALDLIPELKKEKEKQSTGIEYRSIKGFEEKIKFSRPEVMNLPKSLLLTKIRKIEDNKEMIQEANNFVENILNDPQYRIGEIWTKEYCLRTNSTVVDPKVSDCTICPPPLSDEETDINPYVEP